MKNFDKFKALLRFLSPYIRLQIPVFGLMLLVSGMALIDPVILKYIIDDILPAKDFPLLAAILGLFTLFMLLKHIVSVSTTYLTMNTRSYIINHITFKAIKKLRRLDMDFFNNTPVGDLTVQTLQDTSNLSGALTWQFMQILVDFLSMVFILGILFYYNVTLALIMLISTPFCYLALKYYTKRIVDVMKKLRVVGESLYSYFIETFSSIAIVKYFVRESYENSKFVTIIKKHKEYDIKMAILEDSQDNIIDFLIFLSSALVLLYGGKLVIDGSLSLGELIAFYFYAAKFYGPLVKLIRTNTSINKTFVSFERVEKLLNMKPVIDNRKNAIRKETFEKNIAFRNVDFHYNKEEPIFQNLNLTIEKGKRIAFVGKSGAGKTTITKLLYRFHDVAGGSINVDGIDIRNLKIKSLRNMFAIVSQDPALFNTSIADNIRYSKLNAGHDEIMKAAKLANIHDFIESLPDKYNTIVGERGVKLSGGQKQRVAIARAILKNPPILIMDEATSHLDSESENLIQEAMEKVSRGRTAIIIAHRLSTTQNCDEIFVLDSGKICEKGKHEDLIINEGIYSKLWKQQFAPEYALTPDI